MAVANNFKPVVDGATYQPSTVDEFNNMIGKVGKQMIREVTALNPLNVFNKGYMQKGDTGSYGRKWRLMWRKHGFTYNKAEGYCQEELGPLD